MQNDLEMPQPFRLNSGQKAEINHNNHILPVFKRHTVML